MSLILCHIREEYGRACTANGFKELVKTPMLNAKYPYLKPKWVGFGQTLSLTVF
jgi:hypothetical protein